MKLGLPQDSRPILEMFEGFFAAESTPARVRAAEPLGFDAALWAELVAVEAPFMRLSADAGSSGLLAVTLTLGLLGWTTAARVMRSSVIAATRSERPSRRRTSTCTKPRLPELRFSKSGSSPRDDGSSRASIRA